MNFGLWNIGSLYTDYENNLSTAQQFIKEQSPDILCLQEFLDNNSLMSAFKSSGNFPYMQFYDCCDSHVCVGERMGLCIFSKNELKLLDVIKLPKPELVLMYNGHIEKFHDKYFIAVEVFDNDQKNLIITGHGYPFYRYGLEENIEEYAYVFQAIDNWLADISTKTNYDEIIIGADFNFSDVTPFMPYLDSKFYDIFKDEPTRPSGRKTDAIFIKNETTACTKQNVHNGLDHHYIGITI